MNIQIDLLIGLQMLAHRWQAKVSQVTRGESSLEAESVGQALDQLWKVALLAKDTEVSMKARKQICLT